MAPTGAESVNEGTQPWGRFAPPPLWADVAVIAALSIEVADLVDQLRGKRRYQAASMAVLEGELKGKIVVVGVCGVGREAARRGAEILLAGHHPRWLVSAGFAGALNPALARNDAVLAHEIVGLDGSILPVAIPDVLDGRARWHRGRLLTVDRLITTAAEKAQLWQTFQADVVDMETAAVAQLCAERSARFLSARVVSDDAHGDLAPEIADLLSRSGSYRVGAALRSLWRRPASLKDFWRIHEHALEAGGRLARLVAHAVESLPA